MAPDLSAKQSAEKRETASEKVSSETSRFRGYLLTPVFRAISDAQRQEVVAMWCSTKAHRGPVDLDQRSREVAMLIREAESEELAGVSTVRLKPRPTDGRILYHYRMFLRREHRQPYLMRAVTNGTRDFLRGFPLPHAEPAGMLIITENRKLMRPGIQRYFTRHGYLYRGQTAKGLDVWLAPF